MSALWNNNTQTLVSSLTYQINTVWRCSVRKCLTSVWLFCVEKYEQIIVSGWNVSNVSNNLIKYFIASTDYLKIEKLLNNVGIKNTTKVSKVWCFVFVYKHEVGCESNCGKFKNFVSSQLAWKFAFADGTVWDNSIFKKATLTIITFFSNAGNVKKLY